MQEISWLGAVIGTVGSLVLGAIWYSRLGFGEMWMRSAGLSMEDLETGKPARMILISLPLIFLSALVFAAFLGEATWMLATGAGFAAGLCWVGASFGVNYAFEQKPLRLWMVNAGYHTVQFTLIGGSIGFANTYL